MTGIRDRILKDANGDITDHLRNHIHLTNCIHLKNHMHKNSPNRSLVRDLVVLQRSRSLKDPSASPPRRSLGLSKTSPPVTSLEPSQPSPDDTVRRRHTGNESSEPSFDADNLVRDIYPGSSGTGTVERRLNDGDNVGSLHNRRREKGAVEVEPGVRSRGVNRVKRRRFRGSRRVPRAQNETSVASNPLAHGGDPKNGCGIPWNWSRIHDRGKSFLDVAGRSLSCGFSDSRSKRGGPQDPFETPVSSDHSSESLPLLANEGTENPAAAWAHDYSGELGVYADDLLNQNVDSDLASEARSGDRRQKFRGHDDSRHQNLTQKYAPQTFRDLVGQNLAVQALSNAIAKTKIGPLYVFYGPQGTGKTSCARIFARALTCLSEDHPKPCGRCRSCGGRRRSVAEVGPTSDLDYTRLTKLLEKMAAAQPLSGYKAFIVDDCDGLPAGGWTAVSRAVDRAPRRVVCVLVGSGLDGLPHVVVSRCQKFFFPKVKDTDIVSTLGWIAAREGIEIEKDALRLVASRSDGSLRDAEMTLEQLSLLGRRISVPLVQELVGLISDEKLVDLLDLALSADTANTVKNLREIMESGVEPLALMSQLATVITDILAGSYRFTKEKPTRKFFRRQALSKNDMEKLRLALKTLSEAEKQLRTSSDKLTWLTAALLQLAPDPPYTVPSPESVGGPQRSTETRGTRSGFPHHVSDGKPHAGHRNVSERVSDERRRETEEIWFEVLDSIDVNSVKEFLYREGKLVSVSFGAATTVQLMFTSHTTKSKAEKFKTHILEAFERVLGSPVTIELRCDSSKEAPVVRTPQERHGASEIVEAEAPPRAPKRDNGGNSDTGFQRRSAGQSQSQGQGQGQSRSLVKGKASLAQVIQHVESQRGGWSTRRAVSIAEKLEQENLRLEPRSRNSLCWKAPKVARRKLSRLKVGTRKRHVLLRFVSCGKCLSSTSPR